MKKSILILLLFVGITSIINYGQVAKTDVEAAITASGGSSKFETMTVTNILQLYSDGSTKYTWYEYKCSETGYELTSTAIVIKGYTDNSKSKISYVSIIPYDNIGLFSAYSTGFSIRLKNMLVI